MMKRLKLIHKLALTIFFIGICYLNSSAALIRSVATGNWTTATTWDLGRVPIDGDDIIIDVGRTVTILGLVTRNNVTIAVRGNLNIFGSLILNASSTVVIESGGNIGGLAIIFVGGTPVTPPIPGPSYIDNGGLNPGTPPGYIPLPIELISFETTLSGESIQISWATATELNNDYFTIERSTDGLYWSVIGEIPGAGNSTIRIDYKFFDTNPIPGFLYYRLKQTDYDGQFEYFKAAVVRYEPENLFRVYPNPSIGPLTIITSGELTNAHILLHDISGKSITIPVDKAKHQAFLDISGVVDGVYILEIVYPQSRLTQRILKN